MTVTRVEIADAVEDAFDHAPVTKDVLLVCATANRARPEVLAAVSRLPEQTFRSLRDLWPHLPGIPVER